MVGAVTGAVGGAIGGGAAGKVISAAGKRIAAKALTRGAEDVAEDAAETVGGKAASEATESASDEAGAGACSIHSFTGDTPVLMADGSSQPIDTLKVGDQVTDSKPDGHGTQKHRVDRVIVTHTDHDFVDLTITTTTAQSRRLPAGVAGPVATATSHATATLTTTTHHPFWDVTTHTWTQAASLHPGDTLQTPTGRAQVVALHLYTATHTTYDLTIGHLHTYYVKAGATPVLVHNCGATGEVDYGSTDLS
ncbi:polymorphic toxin-type HINT domain-containing protein [Actinocatenispora sera]|uniref:polymorphic toxin-type HINT domain-containing protein n=1 Tax=Actinocatenispora sera TaxID=390989 RepID=UPI0033ED6C80